MRKLRIKTIPKKESEGLYKVFTNQHLKIYNDIKKNIEISSVQEWFKYCPPAQGKKQWVDKRSAKEMAKFWTDIHKQNDFLLFMKKIKKELILNYAFPEMATAFDENGSPRKNDLCVFATDRNKEILIAIEGKADESFGVNVDKEWIESIPEKIRNNKSKKIDRIIGLYQRFDNNANFLKLKYQLIYWLAGAIDEAERRQIETVFLIVQEFHSEKTEEKKINLNKSDLDLFVNIISNSVLKKVNKNEIVGPIKNQFTKQLNLYVGKHQTYIK